MYCRNGQQTEEEMYNNEEGGAAFNEFLELIGQKVRLKGFNKYKAGLCNKSKFFLTARPPHGPIFICCLYYLFMWRHLTA